MNPTRIQLSLPFPGTDRPKPRYQSLGLGENPFPESGVATSIDYNEHQTEEIDEINTWLQKTVDQSTTQWKPLLIKGSIGVGKTHVLRRIERVIEDAGRSVTPGEVGVSYHIVTGSGVRNLLLSDLLIEALTAPLPGKDEGDAHAEMPLVRELFDVLQARSLDRAQSGDPLAAIPRSSPVRAPVSAVITAIEQGQGAEVEKTFVSWLRRRELTRSQLERIGARGRLEGEGEAVRTYAHIFRLAREALNFRAWILMIDQIEDLWRNREISPLKRARFFTDMRTLIDEGLEGAPIAVILAWNTEIALPGSVGGIEVGERIAAEYRALWSRLPKPVDLPWLPTREHAHAFAQQYIEAGREEEAGARDAMLAALTRDEEAILAGIPEGNNGRIGQRTNQRAWLRALRAWADESPPGEGRAHPATANAPKPSPKIGLKTSSKTRPKTK